MLEDYKIEKLVWDDSDFDQMGWHDATIHGIAFGPNEFELSLDIDYIFKWVDPVEGEEFFRFWVSPCTLVFQNVYDIRIEVEPYGMPMLEIDNILRRDPKKPKNFEHIGKDTEWHWTLECHNGKISFRSVGFKQYVRRPAVLTQSQSLDLSNRGGYSFHHGSEHKE